MTAKELTRRFLWMSMFLAGCAPGPRASRLTPSSNGAQPPESCQISSVLPSSPAEVAGLQIGDVILSVDGVKPISAPDTLKLIRNSGSKIKLEISRENAQPFDVAVQLNNQPPRLGIACDLGNTQIAGATPDGLPTIEQANGRINLKAMISIYKGITFMKVTVRNMSDHQIEVTPGTFSAADGNKVPMMPLSPLQVQYRLHGKEGANLLSELDQINWIKSMRDAAKENETYLSMDPNNIYVDYYSHAPNSENKTTLSRNQHTDAKLDAKFLNEESLDAMTVDSISVGNGYVYFPEPMAFPLVVVANIEDHEFTFTFNSPEKNQ